MPTEACGASCIPKQTAPPAPPEHSLHHGGHFALKLGGLALCTPMMASVGAMEAMCLCPVHTAT